MCVHIIFYYYIATRIIHSNSYYQTVKNCLLDIDKQKISKINNDYLWKY